MPDPDGEVYYDAVKGAVRPRRGPRKVSRGPYSVEEAAMIDAFDKLLSAERHMHGALSQPTCVDVTVMLVRLRMECEKYKYTLVRDVSGVDPHVIVASLDMDVTLPVPVTEERDFYEDLT
jgi:hypothetical protein